MKKLILMFSVLSFLCGCGGGEQSKSVISVISVSLTPSAQTNIDQGQTLNFTAQVANDSSGAGVTWSMSGTSCSGTACGTFSNQTTSAVTYNAPASVSGSMTVTILATSVTDTTKSMSSTVVVTPPPSITTTSLASGTVGTAYSATLQASGGAGTLTWSLASGSTLPAGLSLSSSGAISGTPTTPATTSFTVKVTDSSGGQPGPVSATQQLSLTIKPAQLIITTTSLSNGVVGTAYNASLTSSGGTGAISWSVTSGSLPAGLNLSGSAISGTPTAAGTVPFTVTATDSGTPPQTVNQPLSITINPQLAITTTTLPNGVVSAPYSASLQSSGGVGTITWSVTSGTLPAGLSMSGAGAISGTPTAGGTSNFTVTAKDSGTPQQAVQQALSITITTGLSITTTTLPNGTVNSAYSLTLQSAGGTGTITWSVSQGNLPAGLNLSTSGTISGTPTTAGAANFTVSATDSSSPPQTKTQALSITVNPVLSITTTSLPSGTLATSYGQSIATSGGTLPITWSISSGSLPAGLTLASGAKGVGVISGTPTAYGSYTFTVTATDSSTPPQSANQQFTIVINNVPLTITTTSLPNGTMNTSYSAPLQASGGTQSYTWTVAAGTLPTGLSLNNSGGTWALSGTPTAAGTFNFTLQVADSSTPPQTQTQAFSVTITAVLAIATTTLPQAWTDVAYDQIIQTNNGGKLPITWSITTGTLPPGYTLQSTASGSGLITGTYTTYPTIGYYNFTVKATDSSSPPETATQPLTILAQGAPVYLSIVTATLPNGTVNTAYNVPLLATGGIPPYTWTVTSGSTLPSWVTLSGSGTSWSLSGTPTAAATSNFSLTVSDSESPPATATAALSLAIVAPQVCSTGNESALKGQYAFSLGGDGTSGFLAAIGSFTADGSGHITAGTVDANGDTNSTGNGLGYQSGNIIAGSSSYTLGSDNRGCATITTSFYTFITRFAIQPNPAGNTQGTIEEWDAGTEPYIASGRIYQQSFPAAVPDGVWVYSESGSPSGFRTTLVGTRTASGGLITAGEYDFGGEGGQTYQGLIGTYTTPDPTTGRLTIATTANGETVTRVAYQVSGTQQIEMTASPDDQDVSQAAYILLGTARLQSGALTLSGNMVYYAVGYQGGAFAYVTFATINANSGTSSYTGNDYEDSGGQWGISTPGNPTCAYTTDSYGRVATSGTNCGIFNYYGPWSYPPIFYLTGPNTGFLLGIDPSVSLGVLAPQSATAITPGTYTFGTSEVVIQDVYETMIGSGTLASSGNFTGTGDSTSTGYFSTAQQGDESISTTLTVNSDGTFSASDYPGLVVGVIMSGSQFIKIDGPYSPANTLLIFNTIPTP